MTTRHQEPSDPVLETHDSDDDLLVEVGGSAFAQTGVLPHEHEDALRIFAEATPDFSTNAIAVYDTAGKFATVRERQVTDTAFEVYDFSVSNQKYQSTVTASRMKRVDDAGNVVEVLMFPSDREQLIEDALRKMVSQGCGAIRDGVTGVLFTLYQLRQELKRHKHTFTYDQLREGIEVMQGANLKVTNLSTGQSWTEHFLVKILRGGLKHKSEKGRPVEYEKWFVGFHELVTRSIVDRSYRQMNYPRLMAVRGILPKYLYKRMALLFTYAESPERRPYEPTMLKTLIESGRGVSPAQKNNVRAMSRAFAELIKVGAIERVEENRRMEGTKIIDIRYEIYPTQAFVDEVIQANKVQKRLLAEDDSRKEHQRVQQGLSRLSNIQKTIK